MKKKALSILTIFIFIFCIISPNAAKAIESSAQGNPVKAYIRVDGINGTIAEGYAEGVKLQDLLVNFLNSKDIKFDIEPSTWGPELITINGLTKKHFNGSDGWGYYYKNSSTTDYVPAGISDYDIKADEKYVFFYGDLSTKLVNTISFEPSVIKEGSSFKMKFQNSSISWTDGSTVVSPIANALVSIDGYNYVTDSNGEINVQPLQSTAGGQHTYVISDFKMNAVPSVAMDKGTFVVDGVNSPAINYTPESYNQLDNTSVKKDVPSEIQSLTNYLTTNSNDPWSSIDLSKIDKVGSDTYIKDMAKFIKEYGIENMSNTDLEKLILNLTALSYNPYSFVNKDLVKELYNRDLNSFLLNDAIFALITYHNAQVKNQYTITEDKLISKILSGAISYQKDGKNLVGWAIQGNTVDPDMTGAALSALSPYNNAQHQEASDTIKKAVDTLSNLQTESGYIAGSDGITSETLSYVIAGLTAVGENPEGTKFAKLKGDLISALISFKGSDGQYKHVLQGGNNYMSTVEAFMALYSFNQFKTIGSYNFYDGKAEASTFKAYNYIDNTAATVTQTPAAQTVKPKLPQTGNFIDFDVLAAAALILCLAGTILILKDRKVNKNNKEV